jgi:hypothetical protein
MSRNPQRFAPAFAVVRVDGPFAEVMTQGQITERITIKKIVATQEEADREVARLNGDDTHRGRGPGRFYFAQYTRLFVEPDYLSATLPD